MDALIENNEVFSSIENTVAVSAVHEQVQEVSIEEMEGENDAERNSKLKI